MGRGDEYEIAPTENELAADETAIRMMLGRSGEPALVEPPPDLATRVLASLADGSTRSARRLQAWWVPALGGFASLALLLIFVAGLALVMGTPTMMASTPGGGIALTLGQLAQPLLASLRSFGPPLILMLLVLVLITLLWQRTRR